MYKYNITLRYDDTDKIYIAQVKELAGCIAHGKTYVDAVKNVETAIDGWLAVAKENGWNIPEPAHIEYVN